MRDIFTSFEFHTQIDRLAKAGLLYLVTEKFATIDLHPEAVSNAQMGAVFEELIRTFAELSNETAGEHFTPREVNRGDNLPSRTKSFQPPERARPQIQYHWRLWVHKLNWKTQGLAELYNLCPSVNKAA